MKCFQFRCYHQLLLKHSKSYYLEWPGTSNASYATCAYDVYSFGKVLLELVTRKQGFSATENSIMKDWMENALAYIIPDKEELLVNIVESTLSSDKHLLSQVLAVSFIAKACLSPESSERPHMAQILLALDHIISARFGGENFKPIGHHGSVSTALVIAKILQRSQIVGWFMTLFSSLRNLI